MAVVMTEPLSYHFSLEFRLVMPHNAVDFEHQIGAVGFGGGLIAGREVAVHDLFSDV